MVNMGVSVVIAVKNEEANIKRCLESVRWADEIIIVDNGSTDNTVEIAKRYTDRIYSYNKNDLIPKIQQFGIDKAKEEWILVLDADVVVPEKTRDEILKRIKDPGYNMYYIDHLLYFLGKFTRSECWRFSAIKLFRKGHGFYEAKRPHCPLKVKGKAGKIKNPLLHYAFPAISDFLRKTDLYTSQDALLLAQGRKAGLLNKKIRAVNIYNLIIEPGFLFFYYFFGGRGFRDGCRGLILSLLYSYYLFIERAKVYEYKNKK